MQIPKAHEIESYVQKCKKKHTMRISKMRSFKIAKCKIYFEQYKCLCINSTLFH